MRREQGFTLIESLIAILVVSIALLGIALASVKSLQSSQASYYRSVATLAALDMREKAWVALAMVDGECGDVAGSSYVSQAIDYWEGQGSEMPWFILPGVSVDVSDGGVPCSYDVEVSWTETRLGLDGDRENFIYSFFLPDFR